MDGTVQNVKVHTPGAVVTAGDVLMTVVPDGTGIEIDAGVENRDIGFVREGQAVEVKVKPSPSPATGSSAARCAMSGGTLRRKVRRTM